MSPKRKNPEPENGEDGQTNLPAVPVGTAPAFAAKTPQYVNQLRESVIREVNEYTRTLISESEGRLLEAIRALLPKPVPVDPSKMTRGGQQSQSKRPKLSHEERHGSPVRANGGEPSAGPADDAKIATGGRPSGSKRTKLDQKAHPDPPPKTTSEEPLVSNVGQTKEKGEAASLAGERKKSEVTTYPHPNAFDYPVIDGFEAGEASFAPLRRYWTFHRALIPKKNGRVPFMHITGHKGILDKYIFSAISCVTAFSAYTDQRINPEVFPASLGSTDIVVTDKTREFFLPFVISDGFAAGKPHTEGRMHTILLHCEKNEAGTGLTVRVLDSAPTWYNKKEATWKSVIADMLDKIGLDEPITWARTKVYRQETRSETCGLFVILNAWVAAMRLEGNVGFKASEKFYAEAVKIINLALSGHLDSATLYHWLLHHGYIKDSLAYSSDTVRKFERTWTAASDRTFENFREDYLNLANNLECLKAIDERPDRFSQHQTGRLPPQDRAKDDIRQAWKAIKEDVNIDIDQVWKLKQDCAEFTKLYPNEAYRRQRVNDALKDAGELHLRVQTQAQEHAT